MTSVFDVLASYLRQLVDGLEAGKATTDGGPELGSPADLAIKNNAFTATWSDSPGLDLANHIRLLVVSANDHMRTLADSLQSETTGINSSYTISRGLLEAASRAWYLTEPGLDLRERLRRYMNERLWSIHEAKWFLRGMHDDPTKLDPSEQAILEWATAFSYRFSEATKVKPAYLDTPRPKIMTCIDLAATSRGLDQGVGETLYRHFSSISHGTEIGLVGTLLHPAAKGTTMTFGKHSEQQAKHFVVPLLIYASMAERFIAYFGWSSTQWNLVDKDALHFWITHASQGATVGGATEDQARNTAPSD